MSTIGSSTSCHPVRISSLDFHCVFNNHHRHSSWRFFASGSGSSGGGASCYFGVSASRCRTVTSVKRVAVFVVWLWWLSLSISIEIGAFSIVSFPLFRSSSSSSIPSILVSPMASTTRINNENPSRKVKAVNQYEYIDPSIRSILLLPPAPLPRLPSSSPPLVDVTRLCWNWEALERIFESNDGNGNMNVTENATKRTLTPSELVGVAQVCDVAVSEAISNPAIWNQLPSFVRALLRLVDPTHTRSELEVKSELESESKVVVATLITLNFLESSIRKQCQKQKGRAPLLATMIEILAARPQYRHPSNLLPRILRTLLTPKDGGINLRNLLWHGFAPALPRRWFSLCLVLSLSLDHPHHELISTVTNSDSNATLQGVQSLQQHPSLTPILHHGHTLLTSNNTTSLYQTLLAPLPSTHHPLLQAALHLQPHLHPACFAAVAGPLIEHTLRLWWCDANPTANTQTTARPEEYYVTLDGHGQRDKHDVLLLPYRDEACMDENGLVSRMGGAAMAFLTDLFASPPHPGGTGGTGGGGGPNVRASIAHGLWDEFLIAELESMDRCFSPCVNGDHYHPILLQPQQSTQMYPTRHPLLDVSYALLSALHLLASISKLESNLELELELELESNLNTALEMDLHRNRNRNMEMEMEMEMEIPLPKHIFSTYKPLFSYTATMTRNANHAIDKLTALHNLITTNEFVISSITTATHEPNANANQKQKELSHTISAFTITPSILTQSLHSILQTFALPTTTTTTTTTTNSQPWTAQHVLGECRCNRRIAQCGAARALLADVADATDAYLHSLQQGLLSLGMSSPQTDRSSSSSSLSSRKRKVMRRLCSVGSIWFSAYSFAALVALLHIDFRVRLSLSEGDVDCTGTVLGDRSPVERSGTCTGDVLLDECLFSNVLDLPESVLLKAVERSRMVVSTVSNSSNVDRAMKALLEYIAGKSVKSVAKAIGIPL